MPATCIARLPKEASKTRDITGGLPRVAELFEARRPKDPAIIAEAAGRVEYGKDYKTKRRLRIVPPEEDREAIEYLIPKGRHVVVQEGDVVREGDLLVDGNPVPHDILQGQGRRGAGRASWSTRSRRSTGCRASRSTTSTSR